ncbi:MAG: FkbM family methyltransferase [Anaerolineaceae bacterium]
MRFLRKWTYYAWSVLEMLADFRNWGDVFRLFLGGSSKELTWLKFWKRPLKMAVRGRMDAWSVKECFLDRFYTRYGCEIGADWHVVDIGAAIGEFTVFAALAAKCGKVYAFEPNPESVAILHENLKANALENVEAWNLGVWDKPGQMELELIHDEPLQAQTVEQATPNDDSSRVPVITLGQLTAEFIHEPIDLLKLDCEGAEYRILLPSNHETMLRIRRIVMEYHDLGGSDTHAALVDFLDQEGFAVSLHENPVHQDIGYLFAERV